MVSRVFTEKYYSSIFAFKDAEVPCVVNGTFSSIAIAKNTDPHYNLITTNQTLVRTLAELKKRGPLYDKLKQEIHEHGAKGWSLLNCNLGIISYQAHAYSHPGWLENLNFKVTNFFRSLVGYPPLTRIILDAFNCQEFEQIMEEASLRITDAEKNTAKYTMRVLSGPASAELTEDNLHKIEHGLMNRLLFTYDQQRYHIYYSPQKKEFHLGVSSNDNHLHGGFVGQWKKWFDYCLTGKPEVHYTVAKAIEWHNGQQTPLELCDNNKVKYKWSGTEYSSDYHPIILKPGAEYTLLPASGSTSAPLKFSFGNK